MSVAAVFDTPLEDPKQATGGRYELWLFGELHDLLLFVGACPHWLESLELKRMRWVAAGLINLRFQPNPDDYSNFFDIKAAAKVPGASVADSK